MRHLDPPSSAEVVRRYAGFAGLAGALLFAIGDMLFYGFWGPGTGFPEGMRVTVLHASLPRLFAGGLVGPVAACFCMVGFWHVYLNVQSSSRLAGRLALASFLLLMVAGGAVHTLWTARGLAIKFCDGQAAPCSDLLTATTLYWKLAYNLAAIPGYFGFLLLAALVLLDKTRYPRWTVLVNPAVLGLLAPMASRIPAPLGAVVVGGFTNLTIVVFFGASIVTTRAIHDR
jgi:hypothetical protein